MALAFRYWYLLSDCNIPRCHFAAPDAHFPLHDSPAAVIRKAAVVTASLTLHPINRVAYKSSSNTIHGHFNGESSVLKELATNP